MDDHATTATTDPATSALVALKNAAVDVTRLAERAAKRDIEIEALCDEVRKFQQWIHSAINSGDPEADCEWLCEKVCAGPCEGLPVGPTSGNKEQAGG